MIFFKRSIWPEIIVLHSELGPYKKIFSDVLGAPQTFLPDYKEALVLTPSAAFFLHFLEKKTEDLNITQIFSIYLTG